MITIFGSLYAGNVDLNNIGLEEINVGFTTMGTPEQVTLEQLEWFGKEVMPAFKSQAT